MMFLTSPSSSTSSPPRSLRLPFFLRVKGAPPRPHSSYISGAHRQPSRSKTSARGRGPEPEDMLANQLDDDGVVVVVAAATAISRLLWMPLQADNSGVSYSGY